MSWHVGQPFTSTYSRWALELAAGGTGASGVFDEKLYHHAIASTIQPQLSDIPEKLAACYRVGPAGDDAARAPSAGT